MFQRRVDKNFKKQVVDNLKSNAEENALTLQAILLADAGSERPERLKDFIAIYKELLKDRVPAKPKYFGLLLLNAVMDTRKKAVVVAG